MVVALLNPGDEVLIPSPYWVSYPEQARLVGAMPIAVPTEERTGFDLDPERLGAAVTPRTKVVILNSPNNPTGAVFSARALEAVARLALERRLWVVSDECYEALTLEGPHMSVRQPDRAIKALAGSADVTEFLLEHAQVAVVPGVDFGSDAHVRLSYATSAELIRQGLARMHDALSKLE